LTHSGGEADETDDYIYDHGASDNDYNEEPSSVHHPSFTSEAQTFRVAKGRLIRLPCRVDSLGK